jgi:cyclopropane-fatty-acyl-phospholipid synthase
MKTMQGVLADRQSTRKEQVRDSEASLIINATKQMATILSENRMCVWITLGGVTLPIGDQANLAKEAPEFIFDSVANFRTVFQRMRLINFAMAFIEGRMKINGSITKAIEVLDVINVATDAPQTIVERAKSLLFRTGKVILPTFAAKFDSLEHYAQSASAFELFLDDWMQYTCGRFEGGDEDITQAQVAKFSLIEQWASKHMGSLAGKDHLDIGCGWGGMPAYFSSRFGTRSVGNTNCLEQMQYAQRRYGVDVLYGDFYRLKDSGRRFDLITIVGMIEHLTPYRRSQLLNVVTKLLKNNGLVYLQCIAKPRVWIGGDVYRITQREVFPGNFLETPEETDYRVTKHGFRILERVDHYSDYGLTTLRWVDNIRQHETQLTSLLGGRKYRMFLGYLGFGSRMFLTGRGSLMRYLLTRSL